MILSLRHCSAVRVSVILGILSIREHSIFDVEVRKIMIASRSHLPFARIRADFAQKIVYNYNTSIEENGNVRMQFFNFKIILVVIVAVTVGIIGNHFYEQHVKAEASVKAFNQPYIPPTTPHPGATGTITFNSNK